MRITLISLKWMITVGLKHLSNAFHSYDLSLRMTKFLKVVSFDFVISINFRGKFILGNNFISCHAFAGRIR